YVPKEVSCRLPLNVPVHGVLEQDGADDPLPVKAGARNHAGAHLVHYRKHLILVGPRTFFDSVKTQCTGSAATALIQRGYKARMCLHLLELLLVVVDRFHNASFNLHSSIFGIDKSGYWLSYRG